MMSPYMKPAVLLVLLACGLAGCLTSQGSAKAMYAAKYNCPEGQLTYEDLGNYNVIMVRGCGFEQLYTCDPHATCARDGERRPIGSGAAPAQSASKP